MIRAKEHFPVVLAQRVSESCEPAAQLEASRAGVKEGSDQAVCPAVCQPRRLHGQCRWRAFSHDGQGQVFIQQD
jgi:hypothetical protein